MKRTNAGCFSEAVAYFSKLILPFQNFIVVPGLHAADGYCLLQYLVDVGNGHSSICLVGCGIPSVIDGFNILFHSNMNAPLVVANICSG